jgi:hypothetical protein
MTPHDPEVEILLGLGGTFRRVPLASISAVTRVPLPLLRESCSGLLLSFLDRSDKNPQRPEGEPKEGEVGNVRFVSFPNVSSDNVPNVPESQRGKEALTLRNERNEPSDAPAREVAQAVGETSNPASGEFLALLLDDTESLPFYDQLVASVPRELIARALDLTLARRSTIRGRPAAYFTAIVRRLTEPHSYARTPSSPP